MGKSIILGDIMPANLLSEVNGAATKTTSPNLTNLKEPVDVKNDRGIKMEKIDSS